MIPLPHLADRPDHQGVHGAAVAPGLVPQPLAQAGGHADAHGDVLVGPVPLRHSGTRRAVPAGCAGGVHDVVGGRAPLVLAHGHRESDGAVAVVPPAVGVHYVAAGVVRGPCDLLHAAIVRCGSTARQAPVAGAA